MKHARTLTAVIAVLTLALTTAPAFATRILIDVGHNGTGYPTLGGPPYYVNVMYPFPPQGSSYLNIIDTNNIGTGIDLIVSNWNNSYNVNGVETGAFDYLSTATRDNAFASNPSGVGGFAQGGTGYVYFTGLEVTKLYKFTIFASRTGVSDNREAQYRFYADGDTDTSVYLDAANNYTNRVSTDGLKPDANGQILLEVGPGPNNNNGNKYVYLGVLDISIIPEPVVTGLALLVLVAAVRRM